MIDWKQTQRNLTALKLYTGAIDGIAGEGTWRAALGVIASPNAKSLDIQAMARALAGFAEPIGLLTAPSRLIGYLSNTANETGGFSDFDENLNYSAQRMSEVWPNRYRGADGKPNSLAVSLANNPIAFANATYGARMGNERNGVNDDDGYKYRGLGPIATTGYDNFLAAEKRTGIPFTDQPGLMAHPGVGTIGALVWWARSGCNDWLDKGNPTAARSIANTGSPGNPKPEGLPAVLAFAAKLQGVIV